MAAKRIITGLLFVPVFLTGILWSYGPWFTAAAVWVFFLFSRHELYALFQLKSCPNIAIWQNALAALFMAAAVAAPWLTAPFALLFFWGSSTLTIRRSFSGAATEISVHGLALIYLLAPLACFAWLRSIEHGMAWLYFLLAVGCITDSGAYFGGKLFGRRRLAPRLSPNKTWEGAIAGTLSAVAFIAISIWIQSEFWSGSMWIGANHSYLEPLLAAFGLSLIGQTGDLFESALKRDRGLKDSGPSNTGHGGVLDMIDGLLWAAPALAAYALVRING